VAILGIAVVTSAAAVVGTVIGSAAYGLTGQPDAGHEDSCSSTWCCCWPSPASRWPCPRRSTRSACARHRPTVLLFGYLEILGQLWPDAEVAATAVPLSPAVAIPAGLASPGPARPVRRVRDRGGLGWHFRAGTSPRCPDLVAPAAMPPTRFRPRLIWPCSSSRRRRRYVGRARRGSFNRDPSLFTAAGTPVIDGSFGRFRVRRVARPGKVRMRYALDAAPFGDLSDPLTLVRPAERTEAAGWDGSAPGTRSASRWTRSRPTRSSRSPASRGDRADRAARLGHRGRAGGRSWSPRLRQALQERPRGMEDGARVDASAFGEDWESAVRVARMDEAAGIVDAFLRGETVTHAGPDFPVDGVGIGPRPLQRPRPPIWMGAFRPGGIRRAACGTAGSRSAPWRRDSLDDAGGPGGEGRDGPRDTAGCGPATPFDVAVSPGWPGGLRPRTSRRRARPGWSRCRRCADTGRARGIAAAGPPR
jgi:hypothetical protein